MNSNDDKSNNDTEAYSGGDCLEAVGGWDKTVGQCLSSI